MSCKYGFNLEKNSLFNGSNRYQIKHTCLKSNIFRFKKTSSTSLILKLITII